MNVLQNFIHFAFDGPIYTWFIRVPLTLLMALSVFLAFAMMGMFIGFPEANKIMFGSDET